MSINKELELEQPIQDLRHETLLNIVRTVSVLSVKGEAFFRKYGITEAQFNVLFALKYKKKKWTQSELGRRLVVTRASITSILDKLEIKGLVIRNSVKGNRRIRHVELTPEGLALIKKMEPIYRKNIHRLLSCFTDKQCSEIIKYMETIRQQLKNIQYSIKETD
ncbi:MAG TPA: MarR family transcriptional regulator [Candidatus Hydrogenedens sp.]|nr:MarR family transcriptional regulator [Candidatus Hydrogenedens sp.]HOK08669.1 MarR family transcriptional regulator [Candidatus Hydrogenedens sp.]HOL20905.1 MarR family transcriptional regulator [Candidatus Hydrogenedens sp.]HPP58290.1 MarR family transcriptional regulator [Candidatus Hydrogenedens sp.]